MSAHRCAASRRVAPPPRSEILDLAKKEDFRVNLIEAYDRPWKRQLEGAVGGYWGLFDAVKRVVKYPPGIDISNFPRWKLKMCGGMGLSFLTFLVAWLTRGHCIMRCGR